MYFISAVDTVTSTLEQFEFSKEASLEKLCSQLLLNSPPQFEIHPIKKLYTDD